MSADAVLTCDCGRSITVPLRPGSGNDPRIDLPEEWNVWFVDDRVDVECPAHSGVSVPKQGEQP